MKQAMIFAAGLGTRLKPLTDTMPKALVRVGGLPLLWHVVQKLKAAGYDLLGKMMNIDDDFGHTDAFELLDENLHERFSINRHHCLGHCISKRFEACA